MFYCDPCAKRLKWPQTLSMSRGTCEVCGVYAVCNDCPSYELPRGIRSLAEEWAELHDHED